MKKMKALLALGLCLACISPISAQEKTSTSSKTENQDSISIRVFTGCRVILIGRDLRKLTTENHVEILKNKFIEDYRASLQDKDFPATAKNIIYLAGADGRRRLKAIPDEVRAVNIKEEIESFNLLLPPFHYIIFDLTQHFEYHIYISQPEKLDSLYSINCTQLIAQATRNQSKASYRLSNTFEIVSADTSYYVKSLSGRKNDMLVLVPTVGLSLVNSRFAPAIGYDVYFQKNNKYGKPVYQVGVNYNFLVFADYNNRSFSNFHPISTASLYYLRNFGNLGTGLSIGFYTRKKDSDSSHRGSLNNAWKIGLINRFHDFGLEYNLIFDKQKNTNAAITLRYYL